MIQYLLRKLLEPKLYGFINDINMKPTTKFHKITTQHTVPTNILYIFTTTF